MSYEADEFELLAERLLGIASQLADLSKSAKYNHMAADVFENLSTEIEDIADKLSRY